MPRRAGYIGFNRSPAAGVNGAASGMWGLNEVQEWRRASSWPSAAPPTLDPTTISGCNLWLDFSDSSSITLVSGAISQINDKSGNGFHATQSTAGNRPTISTMNGLNCGDWGSSQNSKSLKYSPGGTSNNWREFIVVCQWTAGFGNFNAYEGLFTGSTETGTSSGLGLVGDNGSTAWYTVRWVSTVLLNGTSTFTAFPAIQSPSVVHGYASSDIGVNGYAIGFDRVNADRGWRGKIAEVICYNRALTSEERTSIRASLKTKWGTL